LKAALATATAFGWKYHRATTLFALAQARQRRLGRLDEEGRSWLSQSSELCRAHGFQSWIPQIDDLAGRPAPPSPSEGDARVTRARPQDYVEAAGEKVAGMAEESKSNDDSGYRPRG
jgi:hypothetical protein